MLGHWLFLLYPQLFEENISAVENGRGRARSGPLHTTEAGQLRGVNIGRSVNAMKLRMNIAAELRHGNARFFQVRINLPPDLITRVVNRHIISFLALEIDVTDIDSRAVTGTSRLSGGASSRGTGRGIRLLLLGGGCLVGDLVTDSLELLEVLPRGRVGAVALTFVRAVLTEKATERLDTHAELSGQSRLGDDACIKSTVDFTAHLITVVGERSFDDDVLKFIGCRQGPRSRRSRGCLALPVVGSRLAWSDSWIKSSFVGRRGAGASGNVLLVRSG